MGFLLNHDTPRGRGFTVIEMMIVLVIVAVLGTLAAPPMVAMLRTAKVRTVASDFYAALVKARSESIKRRVNVTVAPVGTAGWTTGWTVKYGTTTLINHEALASDVTVQVDVPAATANPIVYGSNGRVSSSAATIIIYAPGDSSVQARCVSADPAGLPRVRIDTNGVATDGCN